MDPVVSPMLLSGLSPNSVAVTFQESDVTVELMHIIEEIRLAVCSAAVVGDRAFSVAAARAWNSLPPQTRAASSILTFRRETKSHLFRQSFG